MTQQARPWLRRCESDAKLLERSGLDEFTLRILRRKFYQVWEGASVDYRQVISNNGTLARFAFMDTILRVRLVPAAYSRWLAYIDHSRQDVDEMCRGDYPISPYLIRLASALFGIKVDFLLLGTAPTADRLGANIDHWPVAQTSRGGAT